jgi:hypothetical protein
MDASCAQQTGVQLSRRVKDISVSLWWCCKSPRRFIRSRCLAGRGALTSSAVAEAGHGRSLSPPEWGRPQHATYGRVGEMRMAHGTRRAGCDCRNSHVLHYQAAAAVMPSFMENFSPPLRLSVWILLYPGDGLFPKSVITVRIGTVPSRPGKLKRHGCSRPAKYLLAVILLITGISDGLFHGLKVDLAE